jgi:hypothetical protein
MGSRPSFLTDALFFCTLPSSVLLTAHDHAVKKTKERDLVAPVLHLKGSQRPGSTAEFASNGN